MIRFDLTVAGQQTRRITHTAGRKTGSGVLRPEVVRLRCGAVAGKSVHGPMT